MHSTLSDATPRVSWPMEAKEVVERLDRLQDHGFITGWRREGRYWWVEYPGAYRWYTLTQVGAWVDGANAMGAAT